ncbi:M48 family metallopeptidase [Nocardioides panacisoli]|uniref:M48 family metallopeptidase n=1 Tax=Nocardioides panacisoli TaxID=627624 RepID=A0ABP7I9N6_9ACTN
MAEDVGPASGAEELSRQTMVVAVGTALLGAAAFLLIATSYVPWHPVAGGMPAPVDPSSVFTQAQIDRAEDYAHAARFWSRSSLAVSLAVALWLGLGRRGRALADRLRGPWWLRVLVVVAALEVIGRVATLPFAIGYQRRSLEAGLSTEAWSSWIVDLLKGELVAIVAIAVPVLVVVACARRWTRAWPAVVGSVLAALVVLGSFVYPLVVEPLFNHFEPLPDGPLRTAVLRVAAEEHVHVDDVLVADASRRTTTLNAYVSGFGSSRRVVLYDNLVDDVPRKQAISVVAHELGHAGHDDVLIGTALGAAGALLGGGLLGIAMVVCERRGRPGAAQVAAVPMVLALAALAAVLSTPVQNGISRQLETRADLVALQATNAPQPFIALQRNLAIRSLADPTPPAWSQWWFGSHPTVLQRIALARGF